jgi:hypothetical protein
VSGEEKHLTIEQIERLLEIQVGTAKGLTESNLDEVRRHLAGCDNCQRLVSTEKERDKTLGKLKQDLPARAFGECPTEFRFYELAAKLLDDEDAETLMKHATECDRCGPTIRKISEELNEAKTDQETQIIANLRTSGQEWQEQFSKTLALAAASRGSVVGSAKAKSSVPIHRLFWATAAIAATVILILATSFAWRSRANYAESLLATAYTQRRTLEARIPGAKYAPLRVEREAGGSNLDKSPALLKAEALIGESLNKNPNDPRWLQVVAARARVTAQFTEPAH